MQALGPGVRWGCRDPSTWWSGCGSFLIFVFPFSSPRYPCQLDCRCWDAFPLAPTIPVWLTLADCPHRLCGTSSEPCPCPSAFPKSQGWLWKQLWQKLLGSWPSSLITGANTAVTNCLNTEVHTSLCKVIFGTPGPVQAKCHLSQDCHSIQN